MIKPNDTNIIYASNTSNKTIYKSKDGRESFKPTTITSISKPKIGVYKIQPEYLHVAGSKKLYRSVDSGESFTFRGISDKKLVNIEVFKSLT